MNEAKIYADIINNWIDKLVTVRNYAKKIDKSVQWVYELGRRNDINMIKIDGVQFVKVD